MLLSDLLMLARPIIRPKRPKVLDCSPADRERELGSDRSETGSSSPIDGVTL